MRGDRDVTLSDFSKGLALGTSLQETPMDMAFDLRDVEPLGRRGLRKRQATSLLTATAANVSGLFYSTYLASLFILASNAFYSWAFSGAPVLLGGVAPTAFSPFFAVEGPTVAGQGDMFIAAASANFDDTATSNYYYANATTVGVWTGPPAGRVRAMASVGNRIWIAIGNRLYFSAVGDPTSFPASNFVDLEPWGSGGQTSLSSITGLVACGPNLIAFKRERSYVIYDLNTGANRPLTDIGCVGPRYCCGGQYGNAYFAAPGRGIFATDGNTVRRIGHPVLTPARTVMSNLGSMVFTGGRYLIYNATGAGGLVLDGLYVYDLVFESWWKHAPGASSTSPGAGTRKVNTLPSISHGVAYTSQALGAGFVYITGTTLNFFRPYHDSDGVGGGTDSEGTVARVYWASGLVAPDGDVARKSRLRQVRLKGSGNAPLTVMGSVVNFGTTTRYPDSELKINNLGVANEWQLLMDSSASGGDQTLEQRITQATLAFGERRN